MTAPGFFIASALSQCDAQDNDGVCTQNPTEMHCQVEFKAGTSMATPVTTGNSLTIIEFFEDGFYPTGVRNGGDPGNADGFTPMGALVKAILVNSAEEMVQGRGDAQRPGLPERGPGLRAHPDADCTLRGEFEDELPGTNYDGAKLSLFVDGAWSKTAAMVVACGDCPRDGDEAEYEFEVSTRASHSRRRSCGPTSRARRSRPTRSSTTSTSRCATRAARRWATWNDADGADDTENTEQVLL